MLTTDLVAAHRPGLREDLAALLRASGSVRRCVRPRLVQAHAPRHGSDRALSRPAGAEGDADLAGPDPQGEPSADRKGRYRRAEGEDSRVRSVGFRSSSRRPGPRRRRSAAPTSAAAPTARAFASLRRRIGTSTSRPSWPRSWRNSKRSKRPSTRASKKVSLADLIVLGGCAAVEKAAKKAGHDVKVAVHAGPHGRVAGSRPTSSRLSRSNRSPTASATIIRGKSAHGAGRGADRQGAIAETDGAGDDGAGRRPARARRQRRRRPSTASSPRSRRR